MHETSKSNLFWDYLIWLFEQLFKVLMHIRCIDNMRKESCLVLEQKFFVVFVVSASLSYLVPSPSRTTNFLGLQYMLISAFVSKSFITFFCYYGIKSVPQAQKYGWFTNQTICFEYFLVFLWNSFMLIEVVMDVYFIEFLPLLLISLFITNYFIQVCYTHLKFDETHL